MKNFYEFQLEEKTTTEETVEKICQEIGVSLDVKEEENVDFATLRTFLSEEKGMRLVISNCSLGDDFELRVFIFPESIKAKKKVKDRYIKIMTDKYECISRQYALRLEEMLNYIYD